MIELISVHRMDETNIIGDSMEIWDSVGEPATAFAMLSKRARRSQ
jgi:hypothetical protein